MKYELVPISKTVNGSMKVQAFSAGFISSLRRSGRSSCSSSSIAIKSNKATDPPITPHIIAPL